MKNIFILIVFLILFNTIISYSQNNTKHSNNVLKNINEIHKLNNILIQYYKFYSQSEDSVYRNRVKLRVLKLNKQVLKLKDLLEQTNDFDVLSFEEKRYCIKVVNTSEMVLFIYYNY